MTDTTGSTGPTHRFNLHDRVEVLTDSQAEVMRATIQLSQSVDMMRATLLLFMLGMGILTIYHLKGQATT